jgi:hypothetical protein
MIMLELEMVNEWEATHKDVQIIVSIIGATGYKKSYLAFDWAK